ncbi:MAG: lactonase family protein [Pedobacter sp.]|nr:MAG: lactonase family protein [Pedobacter sp.]
MKKILYLLPVLLCSLQTRAQRSNYNLLIGTYTNTGKSEGIYVYDFNTKTAAFRVKSIAKNVINPSYLTVSKDNKFIYSVNEEAKKSTVSAFSFDSAKGTINFLNKQEAQGADPCYIIADNKNIIVANYSGGNIAVFGKGKDGTLTTAKQVVQHYGHSVNLNRQKSAHVHMVKFTPDGKHVLSNDLGTDHVYVYNYNAAATSNVLTLTDSIAVDPGSGPRHLTFSKDGKFAYLLQEMNGNLTAYSYANGKLHKIQQTTIVSPNFPGENGAADIHISPDGRFLYATNRGAVNTITRFSVLANGKLVKKGTQSTLGKGPRNFVIDPTGTFLLLGNQNTNEVVIFRINKETGALTDTKKRIDVGAPVCLVFTPAG